MITCCSMATTVVAGGVASTRTGSLSRALGELGDFRRHGGREQRRLAARPDGLGDLGDRADEAHVEHAVGLVEDEPAGLGEVDLAVVEQILEAAGRGDDDVDAAGDGI